MSTRLLRSNARSTNAPDTAGTQPVPNARSEGQNVRVVVPATPGLPVSRNGVEANEMVSTGDDAVSTEKALARTYAEAAKRDVSASPSVDSIPTFDKKAVVLDPSAKSVEGMDGIRVSAVTDDSDGIRVTAVDKDKTQGRPRAVDRSPISQIQELDQLSSKGSRKEFPKNRGSESSKVRNIEIPADKPVVKDKVNVGKPDVKESRSASPVPGQASYAAIVKGKFTDRNGEVDDSELDVEAQRAALENWNQVRDANNESSPVIINIENNGDKSRKRHRKKANSSQRRKAKRSKRAQVESGSSSESEDSEPRTLKHKKSRGHKNIIEAVQPMSRSYAKHIRKVIDGRVDSPNLNPDPRLSTQPVDQLPKSSALAKILKRGSKKSRKTKKGKAKKRREDSPDSDTGSLDEDSDSSDYSNTSSSEDESDSSPPSSPSSSDTESSDSSSSPSDDLSDDWDSESYRRSRQRKHARRKHSRSSRRKTKKQRAKERKSHRIIKPIPPQEYSGEEDIEKYHRLVLEGTQFCRHIGQADPSARLNGGASDFLLDQEDGEEHDSKRGILVSTKRRVTVD
ncbi:hypothetical protein FB446DRAFT_707464 [Lentinula raphanica]|nr:hypothetical protein FB446DRAFT_707464 [Lentinula raphanica]